MAKKVKGRKRHIGVNTSRFLLGVLVHAADIQDADSAWDLLKKIKGLYCWLKVVFADGMRILKNRWQQCGADGRGKLTQEDSASPRIVSR